MAPSPAAMARAASSVSLRMVHLLSLRSVADRRRSSNGYTKMDRHSTHHGQPDRDLAGPAQAPTQVGGPFLPYPDHLRHLRLRAVVAAPMVVDSLPETVRPVVPGLNTTWLVEPFAHLVDPFAEVAAPPFPLVPMHQSGPPIHGAYVRHDDRLGQHTH